MDTYLQHLLERMNDFSDDLIDLPNGGNRTNPDSILLKAKEEAKHISNLEYVEQLKTFIAETKNEDLKHSAYDVLFHIYSNTGETSILTYCIGQLSIEKYKWTLYKILVDIVRFIKNIPNEVNIDNILDLTSYKNGTVRRMAIYCLAYAHNPKAEDKLIEIISTSNDRFQLHSASSALSSVGTTKCIPHLLKLIDHKKQDVAESALGAILYLSDETYLPLFKERLEKGKLKYVGLQGVLKYGDKNEIPLIEKRVKEFVATKRAVELAIPDNQTELTIAMNFLADYSKEFESINKLYNTLVTKKWELLWDTEKVWLKENNLRFKS